MSALPSIGSLEWLVHIRMGADGLAWLTSLRDRGGAHGAELVAALGGTGRPDSVADANDALRYLEELKAIERGRFTPTASQRFFNVNQTFEHAGPYGRDFHTEAFFWMPGAQLAAVLIALKALAEPVTTAAIISESA